MDNYEEIVNTVSEGTGYHRVGIERVLSVIMKKYMCTFAGIIDITNEPEERIMVVEETEIVDLVSDEDEDESDDDCDSDSSSEEEEEDGVYLC
mmetsp:Transcript_14767/g.18259  ORF Transcript_14767/g.18259 Transcript_14767/m.18259 type:complete len:93 (-) Transcript_14767:920-1198(-)|eukprot:CAMPEP_0204849614 /NCGR_PEP_ID=MMETSP1347-20130617/6609_1 /ASSEMBLY_ACC=CAM_ASM_000690 /TAXON_ID=215587 /ORGANISM="Aplanochytrium stocchinoi, Strain GSBS06" /LENGTH=92 /DNA_ID=CAMNT_0051992041 /DNA_START=106 /DNA_END=384 /DNA_ORIENTATION=+